LAPRTNARKIRNVEEYDPFLRRSPKQSRSRAVVEAVFQAARERLTTSGDDHGMVMETIARRAGIAIGSLYDYFQDREGLLRALTAKITAENRAQFLAQLDACESKSLEELLAVMLKQLRETYLDDVETPRSLMSAAYALRLVGFIAESQELFAREFEKRLRARPEVTCDPRAASFIITHASMGLMHVLIWLEKPEDLDALLSECVSMFALYLRTPPQSA
jgi:AcrR family transcriptional regulator